jgi:hypothetical protein
MSFNIIPELVLGSHFRGIVKIVFLNSFQDLDAKVLKQVQHDSDMSSA